MRPMRTRLYFTVMTMIVAGGLAGCITTKSYVDPSLPVLAKGQLPSVAKPGPVTVLFEFRTKGNPNARATGVLQGRVIAAVAESGMFSGVSPTMDSSRSAVLKLVIDDE